MRIILLTCILLSLMASYAQIPTDGLVAWYPFNGNANDESGNGNHGTVYGAVLTPDRLGNPNSAYEFNGISDYIDLPSDFDFYERTISVWLNAYVFSTTGFPANGTLVFDSDHPGMLNGLSIVGGDTVGGINRINLTIGGNQYHYINAMPNIWYHAAIVVNALDIKFYINGNVMDSFPRGNMISSQDGHYTALIGTSRKFDRYFTGIIDDLRIYNRALTSGEVLSLFNVVPWSCGDTLIDSRDGQEYPTVKIGAQCWMAENLNIGTQIPSTSGGFEQMDNGVIEKYCYDNNATNCDIYGGLYEWNEALQYILNEGVQGICPEDWHIPTDNEVKILEGTVDSQYPVGNYVWDQLGERGYDVGCNLKETGTEHWSSPNEGSTNLSGFTSLPNGHRDYENGGFTHFGTHSPFWTSSTFSSTSAVYRQATHDLTTIRRQNNDRAYGFAVRCLKDPDIGASITEQPQSQTACARDMVTFQISASGTLPVFYQWQFNEENIPDATENTLVLENVSEDDQGGYRCIVTNEFGSDTSLTGYLTVETVLPSVIYGPVNVGEYETATYSVTKLPGHLYAFSVIGGNEIDNTENSIEVHWITQGTGYIKLVETNEYGCVGDTVTLQINIGPVHITDGASSDLSVYPNPADDQIIITGLQGHTIYLYNHFGKIQYKGSGSPVDIHHLPEGVYLLKIEDRDGRMVKMVKIVKQ